MIQGDRKGAPLPYYAPRGSLRSMVGAHPCGRPGLHLIALYIHQPLSLQFFQNQLDFLDCFAGAAG